MKKYPEGSKFTVYYSAKEGNGYCIRRTVTLPNGLQSQVRLPKSQYNHLKTLEEIEKFVLRINGRENRKAIQQIELKLAYLPTSILEDFREMLYSEIPNQKDARNHYKNLHRYCLKFFVEHLGLNDPLDWKVNEHKWGMALLCEHSDVKLYSEKRAVKTIKEVLQTANRFMAYLHKRVPKEIPFIKLEPISKAKFKDYHAKLNLDTEPIGKYITDNDWAIIEKKLPLEISPFIKLQYYYGLRRSESLATELKDIANGHLNVQRQLVKANTTGPLKSRFKRKTPHWFITPAETYKIIHDILGKRMHPDTLSVKFREFMTSLKMSYELHDLRRTFITRALDKMLGNAVPVKLAVGHANTETTMKYLRDNRILADTVFVLEE